MQTCIRFGEKGVCFLGCEIKNTRFERRDERGFGERKDGKEKSEMGLMGSFQL